MPLEGKNTGCAHHTKLNMKPNTMPLLIETMRVDKGGGRIHLLDLHLERLERSALHLGYPCHIDVIRTAIQAHCNNVTEGVFRLRLTLSHLGELVLEHSELKPTVEPVLVGISDTPLKQSPWLHHKTTNRVWYEQAAGLLQQQPQLFDIVFSMSRDNYVKAVVAIFMSNVMVSGSPHPLPAVCLQVFNVLIYFAPKPYRRL